MNQTLISHTKEGAEHTLDLVNSWINAVDTKASYALSLTSILTGFIMIQGVPQAFSSLCNAQAITFQILINAALVFLLYLSSYIAISLLVSAIMARVKSTSGITSHLFFGHIANSDLCQFSQEFITLTEEQYTKELLEQIHTNSSICMKKCTYYQCGIYALLIAITLCFICCLLQLI